MSGREIGGRKGFEGITLKLRDYRKSLGKGKNKSGKLVGKARGVTEL